MSDITVEPDQLSDAVKKILLEYNIDVTDGMKEAAKEAIDECNSTIKDSITFHQRTGKYAKSFATKVTDETPTSIETTWYAETPEYRLTHLLEKGHKTNIKTGAYGKRARTPAFPHIKAGEKQVKRVFQKKLEEVIENAGK